RLTAPRVLELALSETAPQQVVGASAVIRGRDGHICGEGTIIDDRLLAGLRIARVGLTGPVTRWLAAPTDGSNETTVEIGQTGEGEQELPISVVDRGSEIQSLRFFVNPQIVMQEGEVVGVA